MAIMLATGILGAACSAEERTASPTARTKDTAPESQVSPKPKRAKQGDRILISSDRGMLTAELADNDAAQALVRMLPITIEMRDHLRREKTGNLPFALARDAAESGFFDRNGGAVGER
ncbi:cyclophilin-like fold protein [Sphingomonas sp. M1-B02]|nr:cyclophilin-like fold protein [Sphingomonas sp. S6-11]UZK67763.1 cyclophilin-like fold protein [Sphingomonas sp. S6-11]